MSRFDHFAKRCVDLVFGLIGLIVTSPVFVVLSIFVKLDSRGPVFYRQERVGEDRKLFRIFKFRTMIVGAYRKGARLTVKRDPRITRVGQFLRWTKLDELPQILNVLVGDMSLVGPRPEDPYFVNFYSGEQLEVLSVKPGLIGPSQIDGRDEVEKYPQGTEDTEKYYVDCILPEKIERDLAYVRAASFWGDLKFLVVGFFSVILSQFKSEFFVRSKARMALLGADLAFMILAYVLANLIKFDWVLPAKSWPYLTQTLFWIVILKPPVFVYYGIYQRSTRWLGRQDLAAIVKASCVASALVVAVTYFSGLQKHSRAVFIVDWALLNFFMASFRYVLRNILSGAARGEEPSAYLNVLVAGSGHGGEEILRALLEDPNSRFMPVGIIDHEPNRWGALIHGVKVMGGATDIAMAASTHGVKMVLVSLADLDPVVVRDITEACRKLNLDYSLVPALSDMLSRQEAKIVSRSELSVEPTL